MKQALKKHKIVVSNELGHVIHANGELGFSVIMHEITFCVSVRANKKARLTVLAYSESAVNKLGVTLNGPKGGSRAEYWAINEFKQRVDFEPLISKLIEYSSLLSATQ